MSAARNLVPFQLPGEVAGDAIPTAPLAGFTGATGDAPVRAALIHSADQEQAEERLAIIQPLLDYDADPRRFSASKSAIVAAVCAQHGAGRATLLRWQKAYREGGLPALADRQRNDRGRSRYFEANQKAAWVAAYLRFECKQSYRAVHEELLRSAQSLDLAELPHYDTVRAWLASRPACLQTYALKGRRVYQESCSPYLTRAYTDLEPNEAWVADGQIDDVIVLNDCFAEAEFGVQMRLRFNAFEDYRSRFLVGFSWATHESSRGIGTALRMGLEKYPPPRLIQFDNGKPYQKVARGARFAAAPESSESAGIARIEQVGILARIGAAVTHCLPYHGQAKPIERLFGTKHARFDRLWHQHYTGAAPHLRPDATSAAMMLHRRLMKQGRVQDSTLPPASFFIALACEWIEEYHNRPHQGRGMDGATPAEVFATRRMGETFDRDALALLFEDHIRLKVHECAVEWTPIPKGSKRRFTFFDDASRDTLHQLNDTKVVVAYDPNDLNQVAILDDAGHLLTWAKADTFARMDPADRETQRQIAQSMADRRHLEKNMRSTLEVISRTARAIGAKTPVESMAERAAIVPAVENLLTHRTPKPKPGRDAVAPPSAADIAANFWRD